MQFPVTLIQIEAHPVECHRVMFNDTDESTGRRTTSILYATRAEALEAWGPHGATEADLVTTDARIDSIRSLLHELEDAFTESGSAGVTLALARRDLSHAQRRLRDTSLEELS